jgi:hypothetical protein
MIIDFKAFMELQKSWPKSNDFGHLYYRKKTANNACNPTMPGKLPDINLTAISGGM